MNSREWFVYTLSRALRDLRKTPDDAGLRTHAESLYAWLVLDEMLNG